MNNIITVTPLSRLIIEAIADFKLLNAPITTSERILARKTIEITTAEKKDTAGPPGPVTQTERLDTAKMIPSRREFVHNFLLNYIFIQIIFSSIPS
jgi:hypothetical protein